MPQWRQAVWGVVGRPQAGLAHAANRGAAAFQWARRWRVRARDFLCIMAMDPFP